MNHKGILFIVSAPSGTGKTTLIREVLEKFDGLFFSISNTTRLPRPGEIHGKDYFFISEAEFRLLINKEQMLEWANVHGNLYGTSKEFVFSVLDKGESLILDVDVKGAMQIMNFGIACVSVFILPPSIEELRRRLENRGTDSADVIKLRLENAKKEMVWKEYYDHVLINDDFKTALKNFCHIFEQAMIKSDSIL